MQTEEYKGVDWAPHVRQFYAEWLEFTGLRPANRRAFDNFVALMEEQMGDFLMDQCADHTGIGLIREEDADETE